jgi:hypothetical protein
VAKKDTNDAPTEVTEEDQETLDAVETEDVLDEGIPEEEYEDEFDDEDDDEQHHEHTSLAASILRVLAILIIGATVALWAGPKIAPKLPAGLKPVADFLSPQVDITNQIAAMQTDYETRLAEIEATLKQADATANIEPLLAQLATKDTEAEAAIDAATKATKALEMVVATLQTELTKVTAKQTLSAEGGQASDEALQQFEDKLSAISTAQQKLNQSQQIAVEAQQDAEGKLRLANAANAISRISDALETGRPFQDELGQLTGITSIDLPSGLADISKTGTASLSELKKQLPELSRTILREDAAANAGTSAIGKFTAFMKSQVGTRSLGPQQGDNMDAVLSRIEAALDKDDLTNALTETEMLTDAAKLTMGKWVASLAQLKRANDALQTVHEQLSTAQR